MSGKGDIILVVHAPAIGSVEGPLLQLPKHLNQKRWLLHSACSYGPMAKQTDALGILIHIFSMPLLKSSPCIPAKMEVNPTALYSWSSHLTPF